MRPALPLICAFITTLSLATATNAQTSPQHREIVLCVSPSGNDRFPGTVQKPFKTLERAREAVRTIKATQGGLTAPVTVLLRGGTYFRTTPFILEPEDGGTSECPVTYAAYPGESPIISGGTSVTGWRRDVVNGRNVFTARIGTTTPEGGRLREMWVNGARRPQARYPNKGYLHVASAPEVNSSTPWDQGQWSFVAESGTIPQWRSLRDGEVVLMNRWTEAHLPIVSWNRDSSLFRLGLRTVFRTEPKDPYYILNVPEALDSAGEWQWDAANGLVHYLPLPGEAPEKIAAIIPRLSRLLLIKGDSSARRYVEHVSFRGLTFSHTEWGIDGKSSGNLLALGSGGFGQAAVGLPAAIEAEGLRHGSFDHCAVTHAGTYGLALSRGSQFVSITSCSFTDLGGGGVKIGETAIPSDSSHYTSHNTILDCIIANDGLVFHSAVGIWIGQSPSNRIIHNQIHDLYYSGISLGWTWGYGPSIASNTLVTLNHVHHIGVRVDGDGLILADMGGIYTVGARWETIIRRNYFHDIGARLYGGWGIYYDEGTTGAIAEQNVVSRTSHEGFHQHYGKENVFRNNIIAYSGAYQVRISRAEPHVSFSFERNIVVWDGGPMFAERDPHTTGLFDHNLYWFAGGKPLMMDSTTWEAWHALGRDTHSLIADPLLGAPRNGDFSLSAKSPARVLGIVPVDIVRTLDAAPLSSGELASLDRPVPMGRLLYSNDGSNMIMQWDSLTPSLAYTRIDPLTDGNVSAFFHNVNPGQNMGYPSAVAPMFHWERPADKPTDSWDIYGIRMDRNLRNLVRDSIDPVGMVMQRAWFRGMGAMLSFRMNELHDVDKAGSPLLSPFWKSHPEYRVGGYPGWGAYALNYAIPEVREYIFAILCEVVNRYDCDAIELDFMRFPYYFPPNPDSMASYAATMTAFVGRVRAMTAMVAERRGRPLLVMARVPTSLSACAYVGLDPAAWARDGMIDALTVAPFLSTQPEIPVGEFRRACGSLPIYAGLEFTMGTRSMLREQKRATAALMYAAGADGIYLFNYFVYWDAGLQADMDVLRDLADPEKLKCTDKLYTLAPTRHPVPMVTPASPMPLIVPKMETRTVVLRAAETAPVKSMVLRIECRTDIAPEDLKVWFNVKEQGRGVHPTDLLPYPQKVDFEPAPVTRVLEFPVDPGLLRELNSLTFSATRDLQIDYVYLSIKHGG